MVSDLKVKYKNTILGFFWSLLNPLLIMAVLLLVFSHLLKSNIQNYSIFLLLGLTFWRFFANGTTISMHAVKENPALIQNLYFPREILVIAKALSALITAILELVVFFLLYFILFGPPPLTALVLAPVIILELVLVLGTGFVLSALYSLYHDVKDIWEILLQAGFFLSPIIYPSTIIPAKYLKYYLLNPLARVILVCQRLVLYGEVPQFSSFLAIILMVTVILGAGYVLFKYLEPKFARSL